MDTYRVQSSAVGLLQSVYPNALGFVQEGCLGGAFYLFWSVADDEIVETFCLADPIEL